MIGGEGFDGLGDGVDLDAVGGEGFGDGVEQFTQAGVVVEGENVELVMLGGVEHEGEGRHGDFGITEIYETGAAFSWDNVRSAGFRPSF